MGAGGRCGTILYRNAELVRGLQFYIERRPLARGYNSIFSFFECVRVVMLGLFSPAISPTILNCRRELTRAGCFFDEVQFLITGGMGTVAV